MFPPAIFHLEVVEECGSTQEAVMAHRGARKFHGLAVLAKRQTAAVGRRGRQWAAPEGNLSLSFGLELESSRYLGLLPFLVGIALFRATESFLPRKESLRLKWPNDLYLEGKKLAGLLSQAKQSGEGVEVVVGVGLNLAHAPPDLPAIALSAVTSPPAPESFARAFLAQLEKIFREASNFAWIREEWEKAARLDKDPLYVMGESEPVTPLALLPTGELLVRNRVGTERKLASEEVSLRFTPSSAPSP
jgi:BirA family transcriptional regulator, biotin operon repressor / biotin---[acetyl-CoA-carboxylase] ligase